jgi:hypothetical protein
MRTGVSIKVCLDGFGKEVGSFHLDNCNACLVVVSFD